MWSLLLIEAPSSPALTLAELQEHSRLSGLPAEADADLEAKIASAVADCENYTRRQLITATWELRMAHWCEEGIYSSDAGYPILRLPNPPVTSIASVKYLDAEGDEQTLDPAEYSFEGVAVEPAPMAQRAELYPIGRAWPVVPIRPGAIRVRFVSGYGDASSAVPQGIRAGICLRAAELYERREEQTLGTMVSRNTITARRLWWPFRAF